MVILTDTQAKYLRSDIDEMNSIFQDESRNDWYDGDDTARKIANYVDDILICSTRLDKDAEEDKESFVKAILTALLAFGGGRYEYLRGCDVRYRDDAQEVIELVFPNGHVKSVNTACSSLLGVLADVSRAGLFE